MHFWPSGGCNHPAIFPVFSYKSLICLTHFSYPPDFSSYWFHRPLCKRLPSHLSFAVFLNSGYPKDSRQNISISSGISNTGLIVLILSRSGKLPAIRLQSPDAQPPEAYFPPPQNSPGSRNQTCISEVTGLRTRFTAKAASGSIAAWGWSFDSFISSSRSSTTTKCHGFSFPAEGAHIPACRISLIFSGSTGPVLIFPGTSSLKYLSHILTLSSSNWEAGPPVRM